jgi:hypothetical protein
MESGARLLNPIRVDENGVDNVGGDTPFGQWSNQTEPPFQCLVINVMNGRTRAMSF